MEATIPEGIDLLVNGVQLNSGPLKVQLDHEARSAGDNSGELDYETNVARARFNVRIDMTGVAKLLAHVTQGGPVQPIRAMVHTEGIMTRDHNFGLSGPMEIQPHPLFGTDGFTAAVLPGR
jgi:hypothetical protein